MPGCVWHEELPPACEMQSPVTAVGAPKAHGTVRHYVIAHMHDEGRAEITPFQIMQHLSFLVRFRVAGQGWPNPPVLSGRHTILGSSQKAGQLEPWSSPREAAEQMLPVSGLVAPSSGCWQRIVTSLSPPCAVLQPSSPGPWGWRWSPKHHWWFSQVLQGADLQITAVTCRLESSTERVKGSKRARITTYTCALCPLATNQQGFCQVSAKIRTARAKHGCIRTPHKRPFLCFQLHFLPLWQMKA